MTKEEILQSELNEIGKGNTTQIQFCYDAIFKAMQYQSLDFAKWLSKNNWHHYEELDFFYQHDYKTNKSREETGLTLYLEFEKENNHE